MAFEETATNGPKSLEMWKALGQQSARHVFVNENWLVVDKPAGILSVPAHQGEAPAWGRILESQFGRLWPVHRLDRQVSGLQLWARSAAAHRKAQGWFEGRQIEKRYEALVDEAAWKSADVKPDLKATACWVLPMVKGKRRTFVADHGLETVTEARRIGGFGGWGLWSLWPRTGRTHQLRVALAHNVGPIVGDELYGFSLEGEEQWRDSSEQRVMILSRLRQRGAIGLRAVELNLSRLGLDSVDGGGRGVSELMGLPRTLKAHGIEEWLQGEEP